MIDIDIQKVVTLIQQGYTITSIASKFCVSRNTIHRKLKNHGIQSQRLKFNHDFFADIDSEFKAYWLGFIMADGCVSISQSPKVQIRLHKKDYNHIVKWHSAIDSIVKINLSHIHNTVSSTHYSTKMCDDLIKLGCVPRKSLVLTFPNVSLDLIRHVIRGYFDGDGSFYLNPKTKNAKLQFVGTYMVLDTIQNALGTSVKLQKPSNAYVLCIHGNIQVRKCLQYMYQGSHVFLDRKKEMVNAYLSV